LNDGDISDARLVIELEEDVPSSLGARLTGSSTGLKRREEGSFGEEISSRRIARRTTYTRLPWRMTRGEMGVGHVWACSESVSARGMPQKQVAVGAPAVDGACRGVVKWLPGGWDRGG
jgi:hypothetical protein